jgi:hypothetical protein
MDAFHEVFDVTPMGSLNVPGRYNVTSAKQLLVVFPSLINCSIISETRKLTH